MKKVIVGLLVLSMMSPIVCNAASVDWAEVNTTAEYNLTISGQSNGKVTVLVLNNGYSIDNIDNLDDINTGVFHIGVTEANSDGSFSYKLNFDSQDEKKRLCVLDENGRLIFEDTITSGTDGIWIDGQPIEDGKNFYVGVLKLIESEGYEVNCISEVLTQKDMLTNTDYLLENELPLKVAYVGGSITSGFADGDNCFRVQVQNWFKDNYPNSEISEINAHIGGMGSSGHYQRLDYTTLSKNPDLVFIETAVNDYSDNLTENNLRECTYNIESIIRRVYKNNPQAEIIIVDTTTKEIYEANEKIGKVQPIRQIHMALAEHYNIPYIYVGEPLYEAINNGDLIECLPEGENPTNRSDCAFTYDGVHPLKGGFDVYSKCITDRLAQMFELTKADAPINYVMPDMYDENSYTKATEIKISDTQYDNTWSVYTGYPDTSNDGSMIGDGRFTWRDAGDSMVCDEAGGTLKFRFKGSYLAVDWMIGQYSGDIEVTIDNNAPIKVSSYASWVTSKDYARITKIADNLTDGVHTAVVKALGTKNENSESARVVISAFYVHDYLNDPYENEIVRSGSFKAVSTISNTSSQNQSYTILYAVYNKDGVLEAVESEEGVLSGNTVRHPVEHKFTSPLKGKDLTLKCMFWTDSSLMKPLNNVVVYEKTDK
ncbi:MAG: GDSL-type esterase/lipase family protein [Clostridia bacterium]|nr:GDSL-type esterase/lipase family protein [Clostridia bacterium]